MKTATIPSVRVEPELRAEVESVLVDGETVSEFVEASVRAAVLRRRHQAEFIARGLRSLNDAHRSGDYADADALVDALQRKLDAARARKPTIRRRPSAFASRGRPRLIWSDCSSSCSNASLRGVLGTCNSPSKPSSPFAPGSQR